jgi:hypothetical protein
MTRVNKRTITWFLAALMAVSASAAVPVTRVGTGNENPAIVWIAQHRAEQRIPVLAEHATPGPQIAVPLHDAPLAKGRHFVASPYQRPPPFLR